MRHEFREISPQGRRTKKLPDALKYSTHPAALSKREQERPPSVDAVFQKNLETLAL